MPTSLVFGSLTLGDQYSNVIVYVEGKENDCFVQYPSQSLCVILSFDAMFCSSMKECKGIDQIKDTGHEVFLMLFLVCMSKSS